MPAKVIASSFALVCFSGALVVGWSAGNPLERVVLNALGVMAIAFVLGSVVGGIAQKTVDDHLDQYKKDHPIPDDDPFASNEAKGSA